MIRKLVTLSTLIALLAGCAPKSSSAQEASRSTPAKTESKPAIRVEQRADRTPSPVVEKPEKVEPVDQEALASKYVWLAYTEDLPELTTLDRKIPTPDGYTRQEVADASYAAYLRGLPVRTDREDVLLYNGDPVEMPSAGVIPLDLGKRDLHQCADSVIRLYSEYLWSVERVEEAAFHYTSGDLARWKDWRAGKVLKVKGNKVLQVNAKKSPNTHAAYRKWLDKVFTYASTRSMHRDSRRIEAATELRSGDFFVQGGSPGHVVMILDIAEREDGQRVALLGQGYLPAREFHVISGSGEDVVDGVWYVLSDEGKIATPTWRPFSMEDAWRFE